MTHKILNYSFILTIIIIFILVDFDINKIFAQSNSRPNIILIITDDQGYGDLGFTGNNIIRTPNIDSLARESASMKNFYVSPVCSPTRASLMTGRYNYRTRVIDTYRGRSMMEPEEITIAEVFKEADYKTGIFGKWHLGDNYPLRPIDQGFEKSLIHLGGGLSQPSDPIENQRRYTNPILFEDGKKIQTKGYCTDVFFNGALKLIDDSIKEKKPFFLYIAPNAPHEPFHDVPEKLYKYYKSADLYSLMRNKSSKKKDVLARIYAMVENIDQNIGKLKKRLKKRKILKNTIIVFLLDNGPTFVKRYVGPFRGSKSQVYEGGIRSPLLFYWPTRLKSGVRSDRISAHIDIMPTLIESAGIIPSKPIQFDGRSILPLLEKGSTPWKDRYIVIQSHRGDEPTSFRNFAIRNQKWKLLRSRGFSSKNLNKEIPFELYDIENDLKETKNLADQYPKVVEQLKSNYLEWFEDVSSTRLDNYQPPRIIIDPAKVTQTVLSIQDWRSTHFGWGKDGKWKLSFAKLGGYKVSIIFEKPPGKGPVQLIIDDKKIDNRMDNELQNIVHFDLVDINQEMLDLGVFLNRNGQSINPYKVIIQYIKSGK